MSDCSWDEIEREWTRNPDERERPAAWHLLPPLDEQITDAFLGAERPSGLDGVRLLGQGWSAAKRMTAAAALALFRDRGPVDLGRLARFSSDEQFNRLRESLEFYRGDRAALTPEDQ